MNTIIKLVWYDNDTEHLVGEKVITHFFSEKELKILLAERGDLIDCYPLSRKQGEYIQKKLLMNLSDDYEYFIEISGDWVLDLRDTVFTPAPASNFTDKDPIDRLDAEKAFLSNDPEKILDALIRVTFFDPDPFYIQEKCVACLKNKNINIQKEAISCIGHLARMHGKVDIKKITPLLKNLNHNPKLTEPVADTLDDIEHYLKVKRHTDD